MQVAHTAFNSFQTKAFGGALNDEIHGGTGQDIILGDFGYYDSKIEYLPYQYHASHVYSPEHGGDDLIYGGDDDDFLLGQEV